jgi:condensin complex subunit 2
MLSPQPEQRLGDDGLVLGDDGSQPPPADSQWPSTQADLPPGSFGSQLVTQQGRRLRPEYVNYARTAKKVDVRRLKEEMWKGMSASIMKDLDAAFDAQQHPPPPQQQQDGDVDMMDVDQPAPEPSTPSEKDPVTPTEGAELKFTDMISGLTKVYPEQQMKDISTSYCFICLLHLANEKGLVLDGDREGEGAMQEIRVRRDQACGEEYEGE